MEHILLSLVACLGSEFYPGRKRAKLFCQFWAYGFTKRIAIKVNVLQVHKSQSLWPGYRLPYYLHVAFPQKVD